MVKTVYSILCAVVIIVICAGCANRAAATAGVGDSDSCYSDSDSVIVDTVSIVKEELTKYILGKKSDVVLSKRADDDLFESSWPEFQCPAYSEDGCPYSEECCLYATNESLSLQVNETGKDLYKYSCTCPCGCKGTYYDDFTIMAIINKNGKVEILRITN